MSAIISFLRVVKYPDGLLRRYGILGYLAPRHVDDGASSEYVSSYQSLGRLHDLEVTASSDLVTSLLTQKDVDIIDQWKQYSPRVFQPSDTSHL